MLGGVHVDACHSRYTTNLAPLQCRDGAISGGVPGFLPAALKILLNVFFPSQVDACHPGLRAAGWRYPRPAGDFLHVYCCVENSLNKGVDTEIVAHRAVTTAQG